MPQQPHADNDPKTHTTDTHHVATTASRWEQPKHPHHRHTSCCHNSLTLTMTQKLTPQTHIMLPQRPHTKNDPNTHATDTHHVATTASCWQWPKHPHHRHTSRCHNGLTLTMTQTLTPQTHITLPQRPHAENDLNTHTTDTHHVATTASRWQWPKHSCHRHTLHCHNSLTLTITQTLTPQTHITLPQRPHAENDLNTHTTDTHHVATTASRWQ